MKDNEPIKVYTVTGKLDLKRLIRQMRDDGVDEDMILHVVETQIVPQLIADQINDRENFTTNMVCTDLNMAGYLITCSKCGMQAKSPKEPPPDITIICPRCLKDL